MLLVPELVSSLRGYTRRLFVSDLLAGLTVGVVALPLAMAFAIASGVAPERGIFTAIVAGLIISLLGGSRTQIGGPTGAFVVIVAGIMATQGYAALVGATMLAGCLMIILGISRMGRLIRFIPFPVVTGFTSGIAVVIFSTQIKDLLGLQMDHVPSEFIQKWHAYVTHLGSLTPAAAGIGISTVVLVMWLRKVAPRVPGMLVAMLAASLATWLLGLDMETIGSRFGQLPRALPHPGLPSFEGITFQQLARPAFTIAMLAAIESLLSATVADGMTGTRHRSNMELVAQGAANIASCLFGGIPATGAIARTATNIRAGAKTPVAGIVHAITLLVVLLLCAPLAARVPLAALAGILVVVSYNMSEIRHFASLLRAPRSDVAVLLTTFLLTVLADLTVAVEVGIVLSALLFIRRMAEVTDISAITESLRDDGMPGEGLESPLEIPHGVQVYEIQGPFFFGAAERFKEALSQIGPEPAALILRLRHVPAIDATGLALLRDLHHQCQRSGTRLILSAVAAQPRAAMRRSGLLAELGEDALVPDIATALDAARVTTKHQ